MGKNKGREGDGQMGDALLDAQIGVQCGRGDYGGGGGGRVKAQMMAKGNMDGWIMDDKRDGHIRGPGEGMRCFMAHADWSIRCPSLIDPGPLIYSLIHSSRWIRALLRQ